MKLNNTKFRLPTGKFFAEAHPKNMIMLHFTAGSRVDGAFQSWMTQNIQIGTPYILDKDGTVYEIFDPKYWAYHLGVTGPKAQNHKHDKRSVPIEVINMGPLKLNGTTLYSWPGNYTQKFCDISETNKYVKSTYRGFDYYDAFPVEQQIALVELVKKISTDFKIPITLPPMEKRTVFDLDFYDNWVGVASHQNFRPDKFDIGPAWDWSLLN
jgi:N-acetyl-anhydromuramyl-L-alanine amidase AmpD